MNRPATIYIDPALKARWVSAAQSRRMKLADYMAMMMERTLKTYPIPKALASQYHGAGYALAASVNGQLVAIAYARDHATSEIADHIEDGGTHGQFFFKQWLDTPEAAPIVRELQAKGQLHAGMCSSWEFVKL